ncbi:ABC transporter ATP-binding protein [Nocardiopsis alba]|uniref:ABC transporter ATP-binding protein n=1 Tax=Nocardiopsis alba TaxID=53437 RepID=A0A7K2IZK0_9ACTN|nr:ABC transporter ATP-binding protein [Nocardiopsis sp. LDBS1602]MEC3891241.1 ABC transporter ATP-binding protein [Nocardiopsis sp. LDBS1602]MYR35402.1 ABC transporter ATP-binding protein [Nocardiopsis alba]
MRLIDRGHLHHTTTAPTPPPPPLLRIRDLTHTHLHHLDLTLRPSEHVALVGLTTPARTTLTRLLHGHLHPTRGDLHTTTALHHTRPHPTLAQAITGHTHPHPDDPHLHHALTATGLHHHPHTTPLKHLQPHLASHLHHARTLYAHHTHAHLLLIEQPTTPTPPPTPTTAHLTLTDHPTLARNADRILHLHHGHVTETGTHHQLLIRGGAYARLYALQSTRTHLH